jgi:hypothetical protein
VRYALEAIAETVGEIIGRVDLPVPASSVVRSVCLNTICGKVPHLRVPISDILLHAQEDFSRLVFAIAHISELGEVFFRALVGVCASVAFVGTFFSASLILDLGV